VFTFYNKETFPYKFYDQAPVVFVLLLQKGKYSKETLGKLDPVYSYKWDFCLVIRDCLGPFKLVG